MSASDNPRTDLQADLTAYAHGELSPERSAEVEAAVASDPSLATELSLLRSVLTMVGPATEIEPTAEETSSLFAAIDDALASEVAAADTTPIVQHPAWRRVWTGALHRYETSSRFRGVTIASICVHAAAAAAIAWMMISGAGKPVWNGNVEVAIEDAPKLHDPPQINPVPIDGGGPTPPRFEPDRTALLPFDAASDEGVPLPRHMTPDIYRTEANALRFPTRAIMVRLSYLMDHEERNERLRRRIDDAGLVQRADASVQRALGWLATRRADDGTWGPVPEADGEDVRHGVTAACVLAFVQDGRSARIGDDAALLGPAIDVLERRLENGPAEADRKPIYSHALALRALTWQWALDFRHMTKDERSERLTLLRDAGTQLTEWQAADGGFGYRTGDERLDASCTLFAATTLADLRVAGVLRSDGALRKAGRFLAKRRDDAGLQGYQKADDRADDLALTATLLAYARELGVSRPSADTLDAVERRIAAAGPADALLAWSGLRALARHGRDVAPSLDRVLTAQRKDGAWPAASDRHCRLGGDDLTTAFGVLSVTRVYLP